MTEMNGEDVSAQPGSQSAASMMVPGGVAAAPIDLGAATLTVQVAHALFNPGGVFKYGTILVSFPLPPAPLAFDVRTSLPDIDVLPQLLSEVSDRLSLRKRTMSDDAAHAIAEAAVEFISYHSRLERQRPRVMHVRFAGEGAQMLGSGYLVRLVELRRRCGVE